MTASAAGGGSPPLKVGVVGARTRAQGIGPYVGRAFRSAGCRVVAVAGTSHRTLELARADLAARFGIEAVGHTDVVAMLEAEALDVLAICSPADVHREHLDAGLAAGVHVLCEKPLWWGEQEDVSRDGLAVSVRALAEGFLDRGRLLALNTQWPFTLSGYRRLFPGTEDEPAERFEMLLSPTSRGTHMVVDAGPHLLSMLAALLGSGTVEQGRVQASQPDGLDMHFSYRHAAGQTEVTLRLRPCPEQPRPAGYGINGRWAEREIDPIGYRMALCAPGRREELPDPLDLRVADFVSQASRGGATDVEGLVESMTLLRDLVRVAEDRETAE